MIKLVKGNKPSILVEKETDWKEEYSRYLKKDATAPKAAATRYRHDSIKAAVVEETQGKCAYCESRIRHVHPGDIEHIAPKSKRPDLIVEWSNLTLVCVECNREKRDYYNTSEPLVNPYVDDPDDHVRFYGPLPVNVNPKGFLTIERLKLARLPLFERRKEVIESLNRQIDLWKSMDEGPTRDALKGVILRQADADQEFSATIRAFLWQHMGWSIHATPDTAGA